MDTSSKADLVDHLGGLVLEPSNELKFKGPFDDFVTVNLTIRNPTLKRIAFKIKTTAPKRYCVKPNSGVLDPDNLMKVNVLLQPFVYDPNEKNKHKFMVQYMYLSDDEAKMSVTDILNSWKDVSNDRLLDIKLKCLFEINESTQQRVTSSVTNNANTNNNNSNPTLTTSNSTVNDDLKVNSSKLKQNTVSFTSTSSGNKISNSTADATETYSGDFESANTQNTWNAKDKNDNLINELRQLKYDNEKLRKDNDRLKDEESRLRKMALLQDQSKAFNVVDIVNNYFIWIIVLLISIIIFLIFKS